jgi:hypothetical protein
MSMLSILQSFNNLFFFGTAEITFEWNLLTVGTVGQASPEGLIELAPFCSQTMMIPVDASETTERARARLSTMLHEVFHVFLLQFSCQRCRTYDENSEDASGHGRAFQYVATALNKMSRGLFRIQFEVSDAQDFLNNWRTA